MDTSKTRQKIVRLREERDALEDQLMSVRGKLVEGCLYERYTQCRKGNCKCTKGKPHGPFLYMSLIRRGKSKYRYVGKKEDRQIVDGLRRHKEFYLLLKRLRKTYKKTNDLWGQYRKGLIK